MKIGQLRAETYALLARACRRPAPQEIQAITTKAVDILIGATDFPLRHLAAASRPALRRFLAEVWSKGMEAVTENLTPEYCRLFVGPYALPCPPYGSVYLDDGQVMGPSTLDVRSRYLQEGLQPNTGWVEPPDHIALELEFMACLGVRHYAAMMEGYQEEADRLLAVQREFLRNHLGRWGPAFAARLKAATSFHLYRFLAEFLPPWLTFDTDLLDAMAVALSGTSAPCE